MTYKLEIFAKMNLIIIQEFQQQDVTKISFLYTCQNNLHGKESQEIFKGLRAGYIMKPHN